MQNIRLLQEGCLCISVEDDPVATIFVLAPPSKMALNILEALGR